MSSFTQILFYFSLFLSLKASSMPDPMSLLSFKSSISLDPSNLLSSWTPSTNHCYWYGVLCDRVSGRVVSVNLTGGGGSFLAGTLTASIRNLTEVRILSLPYNAFSGKIPVEIRELRVLEVLELQGNNFTGEIPHQLSNLSYLRLINLSCNVLTGRIPSNFIGNGVIRVIDLSNNQLSGKIEVDRNNACEFLAHLKLSNNFLVGNIPDSIRKCKNLRTLMLDGNILEGRISPEIGGISELRVLDVSRNSLTDSIPKEIGNCKKLAVVVLTNLVDDHGVDSSVDILRGEYNSFVGGVPPEIFMIPTLQVFWAPRANIGGGLPEGWTDMCSLRIINLAQNNVDGAIPESMYLCRNLTLLDLSSNSLSGKLPSQLQVPCMVYFNVSQNSLSGVIPAFDNGRCERGVHLNGKDIDFLDEEDIQIACSTVQVWGDSMVAQGGEMLGEGVLVNHDFSWNNFTGSLPLFSLGNAFSMPSRNVSYRLFLNNNDLNGSFPSKLLSECSNLQSFSVNLSSNQISGEIQESFLGCVELTNVEAAWNQIVGSLAPTISELRKLKHLDLRGNRISGSLPEQLGNLKNLQRLLFGGNNLTGIIPSQLGHLNLLLELDLSQNDLTGTIPSYLAKATNLEIVLLDHNGLSGEIPSSFLSLQNLTVLDVSFNNLTGRIPKLLHVSDCDGFIGNRFVSSCPDSYSASPNSLPIPLEVHKWHSRSKMKSLIIAVPISAFVLLCVLLVMVLGLTLGRKKLVRFTSLTRKEVVTFVDSPVELAYNNVVNATGNFSIRNLIGTGGFGSTYKAELAPGYLVAVKRLSLGRFQGIQQFDAEIRTLGRIRHKNLVTLIGYYVGDTEMFLIYNYLSGGNLETFIHERSGENVKWPLICKIAVDIAEVLAYLHYSCVPRIVHRDIKPSNILLDEEFNAYLSDFGLARLLEVSQTHATTDVAGTFGYVAPEYATTCRVSNKADVYSFGVVLLEFLSAKKSLDPSFSEYGNGFNIVKWATLLIEEGRCSEFFLPELWEAGPEENLLRMLRLALSCTLESLTVRPSMKQVLDRLKQISS